MPGLKFLFVSLDGLIGDIAWQVVKEGHEVRYFIDEPRRSATSPTASCRRSTTGRSDVDWADVIVFDDMLGQGAKARGAAQGGASAWSAARPTPTGSRTTAPSARRS